MRIHTSPRPPRSVSRLAPFALALCLLAPAAPPAAAQKISGIDRDRALTMLKTVKEDIKKNYYDPTFRGIDLDARFQAAEEKIREATSNGHAFRIIAQAVVDLDDSHTYFDPPGRTTRVDYGWEMAIVGEGCYVYAVKPKSDADARGLRPGDRIVSIDGFEPTRDNLWKMKYVYYSLAPRPGVRLVVHSPGKEPRQLDITAEVEQGKPRTDLTDPNTWDEFERAAENTRRLYRQRFHEEGDLFVWRMPHFGLEDAKIDDIMSKARKHKALVLDLRGNGGGPVAALQRLVGHFFDREIKIADLKGRKEMKPLVAKSRGADAYKGQVVVLVDSQSASAAEVFARVIQLEKRGTVIGDRTAGAVMISRYFDHQQGMDSVVFFGVSVTHADLIMADGRSLERVGVAPDELAVLSGEDMAAGRDPVLSLAAAKLGFDLKPEKAGALFPYEWLK